MENENKVELKQGNIPFVNFRVCSTRAIADIVLTIRKKKSG